MKEKKMNIELNKDELFDICTGLDMLLKKCEVVKRAMSNPSEKAEISDRMTKIYKLVSKIDFKRRSMLLMPKPKLKGLEALAAEIAQKETEEAPF